MALFSNLSLTTAGSNLLSKVEAGGTLQFNRVALGDGEWPGGAFDPDMIGLLSEQIDMGIQTVVALGLGRCRLVGICLQSDLAVSGFYDRELGIFAEDPDDGEILFAAAYSGAEADWIPASTSVPSYEQVFSMTLAMGNATSLTIEVGASVSMVTMQDFDDHINSTSPHEATSEATAERLVVRDDAGQFKVSAPADDDHVVRKQDHDGHTGDYGAHGAVSAATANRIIRRDSNGRAQVLAPLASSDIARLAEITAEALARADADSTHAALQSAHNATHLAVASRMMMRDSAGRCRVAAPYNNDDCVRLTDLNSHVNNQTDAHGAWVGTKANSIARRDSAGRLQMALGYNDYDGVVMSQFNHNLPTTGNSFYQILPSGLIIQGLKTGLSDANAECSAFFPTVFPTLCYLCVGTQYGGAGETDNIVKSFDRYGVVFDHLDVGDAGVYCIAIGR